MKIVCSAIVLILNPGGIPVTVGVTMFILSIGDLSEKFMDFTFDMYFRQVNTYNSRAFASYSLPAKVMKCHLLNTIPSSFSLTHPTTISIAYILKITPPFPQTWVDPRLTFEKHPDLDKLMVRS